MLPRMIEVRIIAWGIGIQVKKLPDSGLVLLDPVIAKLVQYVFLDFLWLIFCILWYFLKCFLHYTTLEVQD